MVNIEARPPMKKIFAGFFEGLFRTLFLFAIGGGGYYLIELLVRGHSHWLMAVAGGVSFLIIARVAASRRWWQTPAVKALIIALSITVIELGCGILLREYLGVTVWNYSDMQYNLGGYICLFYSLVWFATAFPFMWIARNLTVLLDLMFRKRKKRTKVA